MPLVRIDYPSGHRPEYRAALSQAVHNALVTVFTVPQEDLFHVLNEHATGKDILHAGQYLGIRYTNEMVIIQITCNEGRTTEQKKALYAAIAQSLETDPGIRKQDVIINLVEVKRENWSFGNGEAQYAS